MAELDIAKDASVIDQLIEFVAILANIGVIAGQAVADVALNAFVIVNSKGLSTGIADVVFDAEGAVSNSASHNLTGIVFKFIVGLALRAQLELRASGTKGNRAADACVVAELMFSNAALTLIFS